MIIIFVVCMDIIPKTVTFLPLYSMLRLLRMSSV